MNIRIIIAFVNSAISVLRNVVSAEVVEALKAALKQFLAHGGEWKPGERQDFIFDQVRKLAAETPNVWDDAVVEIIILLYGLRFTLEKKAQ